MITQTLLNKFLIIFKEKILESLMAAIFLAASMLIVEHYGYLNWLDALMLRMATVVDSNVSDVSNSPYTVALINEYQYETTFKQSSPLDRKELYTIVKNVITNDPKLVVVDIDISPVFFPVSEDQKLLDILLKSYPNRFILPEPKETIVWKENIEAWKQDMMQHGIAFADIHLESRQGVALKYTLTEDSIAAIVNQKVTAHAAEHSHSEHAESLPINYATKIRFVFEELLKHNDIENKVVFLGGQYNNQDKFLTPIGELDGVAVHAYILASDLENASHSIAMLLDIVVGSIIGIILAFLWKKYDTESFHWIFDSYKSVVFLAILSFVLSLIYLSIYLMPVIMSSGIWLNPGPMILGMFIHAFLVRVDILEEKIKHLSHDNLNSKEEKKLGIKYFLYNKLAINYFLFYIVVFYAIFLLFSVH
jgi:hypothetical protein